MKTDTIIKQEGINALISQLGYVDAERFLVLITKEPFDYTKWRSPKSYALSYNTVLFNSCVISV